MKDLSGIILTAILSAVSNQAGDILPGDIGEGLKGGLASVGKLGDYGVQVSEQAQQVIGDAKEKLDEASKAAGKLGESLGGLLGGKKKDKDAEK